MIIGKIVKSYSHINYVCQIFGPREREYELTPADYAFGQFVRIPVRSERDEDRDSLIVMSRGKTTEAQTYAIGVIYDTILANPEFGSLGPRLSNEAQVELFSPDYISEKAVLVSIMVLGMIEQRTLLPGQMEILSIMHGVPLLSLELGSEIEPMTDEAVQAFHYFGDKGQEQQMQREPYLHMGYIPHIIAQPNSLLPIVTLRIIEQLERLFPENLKLLSIVKRNFAWRLKVETTG
jgi:hypothetical protein